MGNADQAVMLVDVPDIRNKKMKKNRDLKEVVKEWKDKNPDCKWKKVWSLANSNYGLTDLNFKIYKKGLCLQSPFFLQKSY